MIDFTIENERVLEAGEPRTLNMIMLANLSNACDVFSYKAFTDIRKLCQETKQRGLKATVNKITVLTYVMAGRIMITLSDEYTQDSVTLLGSEDGDPDDHQYGMAGLHGIDGNYDKALDMLEIVTRNWYQYYSNKDTHLFKNPNNISIF